MSYYPINIQLTQKGSNVVANTLEASSGPTPMETEQLDTLKADIQTASDELAEIEKQLEPFKNVTAKNKDKTTVALKADLKQRQTALKQSIRTHQANVKTMQKSIDERDKLAKKQTRQRSKVKSINNIDTDSVKMIDDMIFKESRERVQKLFVVYQCMKEAAIDCRLLYKFHAVGNDQYVCEPWKRD
jgi:uncharacterized protein (DUF342 family)